MGPQSIVDTPRDTHPAERGIGHGRGNGFEHGGGTDLTRLLGGIRHQPKAPKGDLRTLRVYISGAHSTGKTTLARWIASTYGLPLVTEVARAVLAELEVSLRSLRVDVDRTRDFQAEVFRRQQALEKAAGDRFVSDRTFDNLAYACHHTLALRELLGDMDEYTQRLREPGAVVFFVRPHRSLMVEDGVRAGVEWEEIIRIDGMIKLLLELYDIDYITISTPNMAERARTVRGVLGAIRRP